MNQFDTKMTELADAIKVKNENAAAKLSIQGMIEAVNAIEAGVADVQFGYINAEGNFQEVDLTGDAPADTGTAIAIDAVTFNTGKEVPGYGESIDLSFITATAEDILEGKIGADTEGTPITGTLVESGKFYECAAVAGTTRSITLAGAGNSDVNGSYVEKAKGFYYGHNNGTYPDMLGIWYKAGTEGGYDHYAIIMSSSYTYGVEIIKGYIDSSGVFVSQGTLYRTEVTNASVAEALASMNANAWTCINTNGGTSPGPSATLYEPEGTSWSGYELVWQEASGDTPAGYVKSETLTEGLGIKGYTPKIGNIYSADTTIEVKKAFDGSTIPITQDGLVFYAPLQEDYVDKISGTAANRTDGSFTTFKGINCLQLDGESGASYVSWAARSDMAIETAVTLVILAAPTESSNWRAYTLLSQPNPQSTSERVGLFANSNNPMEWGGALTNDVWQSFIVTRNSEMECKAYINGTYASSGTSNFNATLTAPLQVFVGCDPTEEYFDANAQGYVAFAAVYDRELSAAEVLDIHNALMEGVTQ